MKLAALLAGLALVASHASAYTNPIIIHKYKMYDAKTGKYFGVRGVDYYPRPNDGELNVNNHDFFTDDLEHIWKPDIAHIANLGANAVRLYAVNPTLSHDKFMCALRAHGMYALIDFGANCEGCAITKEKYPACYPAKLKERGEMIIDAFAKYDNVLAFSAGNEVNHVVTDPKDNAPCQKKFIRDMRAYIAQCKTIRDIPVGVVLADSQDQRELNAKYYNCRTDAADTYENAEWYGLNVYQYCDGRVEDVKNAAGFQNLLTDFTSYKMNIPVMLTEFGCLNKDSFPEVDDYKAQRTWLQAGWLHSEDFRKQFNGGFVFEYSTERANSEPSSSFPFTEYGPQNYGLGYFDPVTCDHDSTPCTYKRMPNFASLAEQYNATDYSTEPLKSALVADKDRLDFPICPVDFPKLSEIEWTTVDAVSLSCPSVVQSYTCPGQTTSGTWASSDGSSDDTTTKPTTPSATTKTPTSGSSSGSSNTSTGGGNAAGSLTRSAGPLLMACAASTVAAAFL